MKNCIILGSGRSGTSMVAGMMAGAGYFMGRELLPATDANPRGFFESRDIEAINERIIARQFTVNAARWGRVWESVFPPPPQVIDSKQYEWARVRWLALIPAYRSFHFELDQEVQDGIADLVAQQPFCFKDPRFCYTLPHWQPFWDEADMRYVVVFRHPAITAASIVKDVRQATYLDGVTVTFEQALRLWMYMYSWTLVHARRGGQWLFLHYDQCFDPATIARLKTFTGADDLNDEFPDHQLTRTRPTRRASLNARLLYARLCWKAGYRP